MMELNYKTLRNPDFQTALQRLGAHPFRDQKVAYNIAILIWKVKTELEIAQNLWNKLLDQFAEKDEKGSLKPIPGTNGTFIIPDEKLEEWARALSEYEKLSFKFKAAQKIDFKDLERVELSAHDIIALEPVLSETVVTQNEHGGLEQAISA